MNVKAAIKVIQPHIIRSVVNRGKRTLIFDGKPYKNLQC